MVSLLAAAWLVTSCGEGIDNAAQVDSCSGETIAISSVQGETWYSPFENQPVTVRGVVTYVDSGSGFYLEEPGDSRPGTASRALFVADAGDRLAASPGQELLLSGTVSEQGERRDKLTTLSVSGAATLCEAGSVLPLTAVQLPLDNRQREALEGMRVNVQGELAVTDTYSAYRGKLTLSSGGALRIPTEESAPGKSARTRENANRARSLNVSLPGAVGAIAATTSLGEVRGVMGHDGRNALLLLETLPSTGEVPLPQVPAAPAPGVLRVVNSNLLNFFNGDGRGGGFPTERGAETPMEFEQQKQRLGSALAAMRPHLLAVQELENDGFGPYSAAATLLEILQDSTGGAWAAVTPSGPRIGEDVITVGLFYRSDVLQPDGPAKLLDTDPFRDLSRQPLAQVFKVHSSNTRILVVANHLKSKGSCPEQGPNADRRDGQGCWNPARTAAVSELLPWSKRLATAAGTPNVLILGDMNAWRLEDPIRVFREDGYVDLVEDLSYLPQHSYRYFGQAGTLDYAFASPALARQATSALIWHINADWPRNMELPQPWLRMSDHDPVIVDFEFNQASTSD